jgi:YbgC/YbaW family acyl-CoA thioester hydrolase
MEHRVVMRDVDGAGVIYFAAPYAWQETAYLAWLYSIERPISRLIREGHLTPAVHSAATYHAPLHVDDLLEIELRTAKIGRTSFALECVARRLPGRALYVTVTVVYVFTKTGNDRSLRAERLPDWLRTALEGQSTRSPVQHGSET